MPTQIPWKKKIAYPTQPRPLKKNPRKTPFVLKLTVELYA